MISPLLDAVYVAAERCFDCEKPESARQSERTEEYAYGLPFGFIDRLQRNKGGL